MMQDGDLAEEKSQYLLQKQSNASRIAGRNRWSIESITSRRVVASTDQYYDILSLILESQQKTTYHLAFDFPIFEILTWSISEALADVHVRLHLRFIYINLPQCCLLPLQSSTGLCL